MLIKVIVTSAALFSKRTIEKRAKTQKTLFSRHGIVSRCIRFDPRDNVTFYFSFGATTEKINFYRRRKMCQLLKVRINAREQGRRVLSALLASFSSDFSRRCED